MENLVTIYGVWFFLMLICIITLICVLIYVVHEMAIQRGRSAGGWIFLSLLILNPLIVMFCLLCLGETDEKRRERIFNDEEYLKTWKDDD